MAEEGFNFCYKIADGPGVGGGKASSSYVSLQPFVQHRIAHRASLVWEFDFLLLFIVVGKKKTFRGPQRWVHLFLILCFAKGSDIFFYHFFFRFLLVYTTPPSSPCLLLIVVGRKSKKGPQAEKVHREAES